MKLKRFLALLLALAMTLALAACSSDGAGNNDTEKDDSNVSNGDTGNTENTEPKTLMLGTTKATTVPFDNTATRNTNGFAICYDKLTVIDPYTNEIVSFILDDWYYEDDTTLVLQIKEGVTFTDGTTLTGEDIIYTFVNGIELGASSASALKNFDWDNATVSEDGLTVTIPTFAPYAPGISALDLYIENKAFDDAHPADDEIWWDTVQGTGPYYCVEQVDGAYSLYALRDNYWGDEEYEYDYIEFKFYAEETAMFIDYDLGNIDVCMNVGSFNYGEILDGKYENTAAKLYGQGNMLYLFVDDNQVEAWKNEKVRQAVAHALDLNALGIAGMDSIYILDNSFLPANAKGYKAVGAAEYDVDLAKQLLAEAGYENGFEMELVVRDIYQNMAVAIQNALGKIGITVTVTTVEFGDMIARYQSEQAPAGIWTVPSNNSGEPATIYSTFAQGGSFPFAIIEDPEWQSLVDQANSVVDEEAREKIIVEMQEYVLENSYMITLCELAQAWCFNTEVLPETFELYASGGAPDGLRMEY